MLSDTNLMPPVTWFSVTNSWTTTNGWNVMPLPAPGGNRFYRLMRR